MRKRQNKKGANQNKNNTLPQFNPPQNTTSVPEKEKANTKKERGISDKWANLITILFTGVIAICNMFLVGYTRQQTIDNKASNETETRAYVSVTKITMNLNQDNSHIMTIEAVFKNVGKTPAYNLRKMSVGRIYPSSPDWKVFNLEERANNQPTITVASDDERSALYHSVDVGADTVQLIQTGQEKIYVMGCILYDDIFHHPHFTHYYAVYNPEAGGFQNEGAYNDAD
jgi:hypothetical protein